MKRFLDHDPLTGITSWFVDGDGDDDFHIVTTQDVEPFLEATKQVRNIGNGKDYWRAGGDMRHEATVPIGVQMEWLTKYGVDVLNPDHLDGVTKLLNDPEWRYLKTADIII